MSLVLLRVLTFLLSSYDKRKPFKFAQLNPMTITNKAKI